MSASITSVGTPLLGLAAPCARRTEASAGWRSATRMGPATDTRPGRRTRRYHPVRPLACMRRCISPQRRYITSL